MTQQLGHVLLADCPWKFGDKLPGPKRGAEAHYPVLTVKELCEFPLPPLHHDCYLLLWRVSSMQQEALDVAKAWGFVVKSEIVWKKRTKNGNRHFGMGRTVRLEHEVCLIAKRGNPEPKAKNIRSVLDTEDMLFEASVGRHSEKPDEFYALVEDLFWGPYVEIFARRRRPGWQHYGNELEVEG